MLPLPSAVPQVVVSLRDLVAVHRYFREQGEDPTIYAPDFFLFWLQHGKRPAQIFRIATNRRES